MQYYWISSTGTAPPPPSAMDDKGTAVISIAMATAFPADGVVNISVTWTDTTATAVGMVLNLRVPSWLNQPLTVQAGGVGFVGHPGSYLAIDRTWKNGDTVRCTEY